MVWVQKSMRSYSMPPLACGLASTRQHRRNQSSIRSGSIVTSQELIEAPRTSIATANAGRTPRRSLCASQTLRATIRTLSSKQSRRSKSVRRRKLKVLDASLRVCQHPTLFHRHCNRPSTVRSLSVRALLAFQNDTEMASSSLSMEPNSSSGTVGSVPVLTVQFVE